MIANVNLVIALLIWWLVLAIGAGHWHRARGFTNRTALLGITLLALATVNVLSAAVAPLDLFAYTEGFRFAAGVFRGAALVLLVAYAWHQHSIRDTGSR